MTAPTRDQRTSITFAIPSGKEGAAVKAVRLLAQGRLRVRLVHAGRAWVEVRGDSGRIHNVAYRHGKWSCSCEARGSGCSHLRATWLVIAQEPER
jgi:hypothetical protein